MQNRTIVFVCDAKNENFVSVVKLANDLEKMYLCHIAYLTYDEISYNRYQIDRNTDILVSLNAQYDIWRIENTKTSFLTLAWIRGNEEEWESSKYLSGYHYVFTERKEISDFIYQKKRCIVGLFDGTADNFMEIIEYLEQNINGQISSMTNRLRYCPLLNNLREMRDVEEKYILQDSSAEAIEISHKSAYKNGNRINLRGYYVTVSGINANQVFTSSKVNAAGIFNKIRLQCEILSQLGDLTYSDIFLRKPSSIDNVLKKFHLCEYFFKIKCIDWEKINYIYFRRPRIFDGKYVDFLRKLKQENPNIILLLEIPTFPYDKEYDSSDWLPANLIDKAKRMELKKYIDAIVTYSDDTSIFGIPSISISNAVDCKYFYEKRRSLKEEKREGIHLIACAQFTYWHGYDRFIEGMRINFHEVLKSNIILHVVGNGPELPRYRKMVSQYGLESYVIFHGILIGEDLIKLYMSCDIGIDSLGRHRSGVYYNSSLKGKEYAANGLLIVSGVATELDRDSDYPYYFRVPSDDTPIDIKSVVKFYNGVTHKGKQIEKVKKEIMEYAEVHFDMSIAFRPVLEFIQRKFGLRKKC